MEICKTNSLPVKRNVARKSTSNRPLKNTAYDICGLVDKADSDLNDKSKNITKSSFSKNVISPKKYSAPNTLKAQTKVSSACIEDSSPWGIKSKPSSNSVQDDEKTVSFHFESDEDNEDINGTFSISDSLLPFLPESNLSPPHSQDSLDDSLDSCRVLNYPTKTDFTDTSFKDIPFYSNKLTNCSTNFSDFSACDKTEQSNCEISSDVFLGDTKSTCLGNGSTSIDRNLQNETLGSVNEGVLKTDYRVTELSHVLGDKPCKITVIEPVNEKQLHSLCNTDQIILDDDEEQEDYVEEYDENLKIVEAISLVSGANIIFEETETLRLTNESAQLPNETSHSPNEVPQLGDNTPTLPNETPPSPNEVTQLSDETSKLANETPIVVPKKRKNKKRKPTTKVYFGSRKKKPKSSSKSNTSSEIDSHEVHSSQETLCSLDGQSEDLQEHQPENKLTSNLNPIEQNNTTEITNDSELIKKNISVTNDTINTDIKSVDSVENSSSELFASIENDLNKSKQTETKKRTSGTGEKKTKKEINEGVLLHVEAAKETDIMRDGKILKDKKELLKDIESKIEKNMPVEVKDFDIQQSLTEEILFEQALRLAHQRTSPRRRPLLSKSETKEILKCLNNQTKYNTRKSVDKKGVINNDLLNSEDRHKSEVDISDSSSIDNSDPKDNNTVESRVKSPTENTENSVMRNKKQQKKNANKKLNKTKKSKSQNGYNIDLNAMSETFENELQDIQSYNSSDDTAYSGNEGKKKGAKSNCRKKKNSKRRKKNSLTDEVFFNVKDTDKLSVENDEECQDRIVPVIIIKNKKVTLAERRKTCSVGESLFTIIKPKSCDDTIKSQVQSEESNSDAFEKGRIIDQGTDSSISKGKSFSEMNEKSVDYKETLPDSSDICASKLETNGTDKEDDNDNCSSKLESHAIDQENNITDEKLIELQTESCNQITTLSPTNTTLGGIDRNASPMTPQATNQESNASSNFSSDTTQISEVFQSSNSDDIVEVVDMDVDSPKTNLSPIKFFEKSILPTRDSNSSPSIPFLDGTDTPSISNKETCSDESVMAIINKSDEKVSVTISSKEVVGGDSIGFPIPTITELKSRYLPTPVSDESRSELTPTTSFTCSSGLMVPPLPVNMKPGFSNLQTSLSSASGYIQPPPPVNTLPGFTTAATHGSMSSTSSPYYSPYSSAASSLPMNVNTLSHFINASNSSNTPVLSSSSYQMPMCSSALTTITPQDQRPLQSISDVSPYPTPTSGLHSSCQMPSVFCPVTQNPISSASESSSTIQPQININTNLHYSNYLHTGTEKNQCSFPYPPPSLEISKSVADNKVSSSQVMKEVNDGSTNIQTQKSVSVCEVIPPPPPDHPPPQPPPPPQQPPPPEPEKPKTVDIPLCIVARDPRLRNRSVRVIIDSHNIAMTPSVEKRENSSNLQTSIVPEKLKEKSSGLIKPLTDPYVEEKEEQENSMDVNNEVEHDDVNGSPKKKPKKKEIDQELLYKTPLSDLHDAPERTFSYSRTAPRRPSRFDNRRDPRFFSKKDVNNEVTTDIYRQEPYREQHLQDYKRQENFVYDARLVHESYSPDIRGPESHKMETYENRYDDSDRRSDQYSKWRKDEFPQEKRSRDYSERRPLLEHPSTADFRRSYRQQENYAESHPYSRPQESMPDFRRHNGSEYVRKSSDDAVYPRWDYDHKRVEGIFPEAPESLKAAEDFSNKGKRWEDENEIRDLIEGPKPSVSRPFYRRKRFSKPWRPNYLRDDDGSSSPYNEELFDRRRDFESRHFGEDVADRARERPWGHKNDDELLNGPSRDRRYHRSSWDNRESRGARSPRRDYEMYEKKRSRSPRRKERNRGPGRGSVSPQDSPLDLESPMSPEPEAVTPSGPTKYLSTPQ